MKTSFDNLVNLFKANDGKFVDIEEVILSLSGDLLVLIGPDMLEAWSSFRPFVQKLGNIRVIAALGESRPLDEIHTATEIHGLLLGEYYSLTLYMMSDGLLIFNCPQSGLSILITTTSLENSVIEEWDQNLVQHVAKGGVGFGENGILYFRTLLNAILGRNIARNTRLEKLLKL